MSLFKEKLQKALDESARIIFRSEECVSILEKITYKNTTTKEDMNELRRALKLLNGDIA